MKKVRYRDCVTKNYSEEYLWDCENTERKTMFLISTKRLRRYGFI
jgi:hypothetical protein